MPPKTLEEQLAELEMEAEAPAAPPPKSSKAPKAPRKSAEQETDALKELEELEALEKYQRPEQPAPRQTSRPNTPKLSSSSSTSTNPRRAGGVATPSSTGSTRTSEDKAQAPRKSGESARSFHQSFAPTEEEPAKSAEEPKQAASGGGGGWWGGFSNVLSTATATADAARKRAEAAYQEIQKNQEAQRWAEQVRGNVGALRGIGGELGKRALPTFTNILHTLAPPISQHERLQIHITHDLIGYPSLDPIIYQTFSTVMAQVEGGDLLVIQRGSESTHKRTSLDGFRGGSSSGWNDGPWWRDTYSRDLSVVKGLVEGTKLARISAESYATEFFASRGGVEEAAKVATESLSETNPVRSSDIFLAIQAVSYPAANDLFASSASAESTESTGGVQEQKEDDELVTFAIYLHDPIHSISFKALSQSFPAKWAQWLDAPAPTTAEGEEPHLPAEIEEIIATGGVDPREWVSEWMEETINLAVGIVAQRYVARRMGVGEGGIGRGKAREAVVEAGGGEAARAGII